MATKRRKRKWQVAAVQMTATADVAANLAQAERLVRRAARSGAHLVALPENFAYLHWEGSSETFKEPRTFVRSRGNSVIAINFQREIGSNVMEVMDALRREIDLAAGQSAKLTYRIELATLPRETS